MIGASPTVDGHSLCRPLAFHRRVLFVLIVSAGFTTAIRCYDSYARDSPTSVVDCDAGQLCYSEFYALAEAFGSPKMAEWHVDRFCVHAQQCQMRGIGDQCASIKQLDWAVQRTFKKKLELHSQGGYRRLLHTHFCCCGRDLCNRLDADELAKRFNLTANALAASAADSQGLRRLSPPLLILVLLLLRAL